MDTGPVTQACHPAAWKSEAGRLPVQGFSGLQKEFKASLTLAHKKSKRGQGLVCSSIVECLPSMHKTLHSVSRSEKTQCVWWVDEDRAVTVDQSRAVYRAGLAVALRL